MLKHLRWALAGAALMMSASCASDLVTGGPLIREGEPVGAIDVVNVGGSHINVVLISACSASTYGLNRLPSGTSIPAGQSYRFTVSAGCWDIGVGSTVEASQGFDQYTVAPGRVTTVQVGRTRY